MKVKRLINKLSKLDQNVEVLVSADSEGNHYSRAIDICSSKGLKFTTEGGDLELIDTEDVEEGYITKAKYKRAKNCIIIYP